MAKTRPSGANFIGFADPKVTKIEWFRGYTTRNPLRIDKAQLSHSLHKKAISGKMRVKDIIDTYKKSSKGRALSAHNVPFGIHLTRGGVKHDYFIKNMTKERLAILVNYDRMNYLLSQGTVLERRVKRTNRYGTESPKKDNWERFWSIKGSTYIKNKLYAFDFSIVKIKGQDIAHVYDFSMQKKN